jgi:hypothetical protein
MTMAKHFRRRRYVEDLVALFDQATDAIVDAASERAGVPSWREHSAPR